MEHHGSRPPPRSGWVIDELITVGRENLDPEHVAKYDAKEDAGAGSEVQRLLDWGIEPGATVVDLGAGTGQFALAAAETFARVVAVDPSPVMLRQLRTSMAQQGVAIETVQAGFLTYEHAGAAPDVVYSRWALHHLPDFWKVLALQRIRSMLAAGSLFRLSDVVFAFEPHEAGARIEAWCQALGNDASDWTRADAEEHVRDEHSTYTWLLEPMLERTGFEIRDVSISDDRFLAEYLLVAS